MSSPKSGIDVPAVEILQLMVIMRIEYGPLENLSNGKLEFLRSAAGVVENPYLSECSQ